MIGSPILSLGKIKQQREQVKENGQRKECKLLVGECWAYLSCSARTDIARTKKSAKVDLDSEVRK